MQEILNNPEEEMYEEEWKVIVSTKGNYQLSKIQAKILMQAIARKEKAVVFKTFTIFIPFIVEFYRVRRFLKDAVQLTARTKEEEYKPIDPKKFAKWKEEIYKKIGKINKKEKK